MINFDMSKIDHLWCVYSHTIIYDEGPKVMFVGLCKLRDVLKSPDARRNSVWREYVAREQSVKLDIFYVGVDETKVFKKSLGLIKTHKPYCNSVGNTDPYLNAVRCVTDGNVFPSASAAARFYDIAKSTMSNHLNERTGYLQIRGMNFERISK